MSGVLLGELNFAVRFDTLPEEGLGLCLIGESLPIDLVGLRKETWLSRHVCSFAIYTLDCLLFLQALAFCASTLRILQTTRKFASLPKPNEEKAAFFCKCDTRLDFVTWEEEEAVDEISSS
jgi:hypothetical protein